MAKVVYNEETRRVVLEYPYSRDSLISILAHRLGLSKIEVSKVSLHCEDFDGEWICVTSDKDLRDVVARKANPDFPQSMRKKTDVDLEAFENTPLILRMQLLTNERKNIGNTSDRDSAWSGSLWSTADRYQSKKGDGMSLSGATQSEALLSEGKEIKEDRSALELPCGVEAESSSPDLKGSPDGFVPTALTQDNDAEEWASLWHWREEEVAQERASRRQQEEEDEALARQLHDELATLEAILRAAAAAAGAEELLLVEDEEGTKQEEKKAEEDEENEEDAGRSRAGALGGEPTGQRWWVVAAAAEWRRRRRQEREDEALARRLQDEPADAESES